jgi:hypothetical protein
MREGGHMLHLRPHDHRHGDRVEPGEIYLNDYLTIDCWHAGKRLVALKISVLEVAAP